MPLSSGRLSASTSETIRSAVISSPESSTVRAVSRRRPAAISPSAESTPLARGQTIREISSSPASAAACIGPAPPKGSSA